MLMTVSFDMTSGDKDNNLERIVKMFGGKTGDCGFCRVGPYAGWRDVECEIPVDKLDACSAELRTAGFKVDETEEF
jgi:hypothetical protein